MKAISYLIWKSLVGIVRNFRKKKGQLILVVFIAVMFVLMLMANGKSNDITQLIPTEYIATAYAAMVLIVATLTIDSGIKRGSSSYRMADIQFVFPSPISPRLILIYGFIKQFAISLLVALWFIFQSFNIRNLFGLTANGFWIFLAVTFIVVLYMPVTGMWLYSITLRWENAKKIMQRVFYAIGALLAIAIIALTIYSKDPIWAAKVLIGGKYFEYVPILGQIVSLLNAAKLGFSAWSWASLGILIAGLVLIVWRLLAREIPFYEEVLKQTYKKEKMIVAKRSGSSNINMGPKKARNVKVKYRGTGAKALFYRQLLEYKKAGFLLFDKITIILLTVGIAGGYILKNTGAPIYIALYASIYLNFIFSFSGKWVSEMNNPLTYIIPGSALSKLWYATAANHLKHFVDGCAVFIPIAIIMGANPITAVGYILAYMSIGALYVYSDVLSRRIFGKLYNGNIANVFKMLCILVVLTPAITGFVIVTYIYKNSELIQMLAPLGIVVYSAVISIITMIFGKKIFENTELI